MTRPHPDAPFLDGSELRLALEAAQAAIHQEFQVSERLDAKAGRQSAAAATWFAIVQGIAGAVLTRQDPIGHGYLKLISVFGCIAVFALVVATALSYRVWRLQDEHDLAPEAFSAMAAIARDPTDDLTERLLHEYALTLASRRTNNETRADAFRKSTPVVAVSLLASLVEFVVVLAIIAWG